MSQISVRSAVAAVVILSSFAVVGGLILFTNIPTTVAQLGTYPAETAGYGWSSNIGWISFDCETGSSSGGDICGTSDYKVELVEDDVDNDQYGKLEGYAWSSNIGWIRFGDLSGCPAGTCTSRLNRETLELEGWARACSVFDSGCSGSLLPTEVRGDWDGWISLNCLNTGSCGTSDYKIAVSESGTVISDSYAWGSTVIGWVNFAAAAGDSVIIDPVCDEDPVCRVDLTGVIDINDFCFVDDRDCDPTEPCYDGACTPVDDIPIDAEFAADIPPLVSRGDTVELSWTTAAASGTSIGCEARGAGQVYTVNGGDSDPIVSSKTEFELWCSLTVAASGASSAPDVVDTFTVNLLPSFQET